MPTPNELTLTDVLTISAILLSPLIAVQVEKWLERSRDAKNRKLHVFRALMANRATRLSAAFVEALNMIDLTFTAYREKSVRDKWKECLDLFSNGPKQPEMPDKETADASELSKAQSAQTRYEGELSAWNRNLDDKLAELMHEMGKSLGYDYDTVHIKRGAYIPQAHTELEFEQRALRRGLVELLLLRRPLPMEVTSMPGPSEGEVKEQEEMRRLLIEYLKGERPTAVKIVGDEKGAGKESL